MMTDRILVIRDGALGDFVLTLPALAALRVRFPAAHITLSAERAYLPLAAALVDHVKPYATHNGLSFDGVVSYLGIRPDKHTPRHAAQTYLAEVERLDAAGDYIPRLDFAVKRDTNTLAVHCGSSSPHKCWPEKKWAALLKLLEETTALNFLIVSGPSEHGKALRLSNLLPDTRVQVAKLPILELAQRLAGCVAFIGHDSGVTHLAAAVGLPVCVLWAGANEHVWKPLASSLSLVSDPEGVGNISVESAMAGLKVILP